MSGLCAASDQEDHHCGTMTNTCIATTTRPPELLLGKLHGGHRAPQRQQVAATPNRACAVQVLQMTRRTEIGSAIQGLDEG